MKPLHFLKSPPFLCALTLLGAMLLIRPFVEMGLCDDFSYVRTAKYFAETGRLDYFGWATPMLGWQLVLAAAFIKLFGFSFTIARLAVFCIAITTAALLQRIFVRCGLHEGNATAATLVVVLSPLYLPLSFSFMSDVAGLFSILLCLYCCLRSVQATEDRAAFYWLLAAALSNCITGTARQIAWLGVLVMVPSTFWLIRKRRPPIVVSALVWACCVGFVFTAMQWFKHQLFSQPEILIDGPLNLSALLTLLTSLLRLFLGLTLFLSPVLLAFFTGFAARRRSNLVVILLAVAAVGIVLGLGLHQSHRAGVLTWLAPFNTDFVTEKGMVNVPELGVRPTVLQPTFRFIVTLISFLGVFSFVAFLAFRPSPAKTQTTAAFNVSWPQLKILLVPFAVAYLCLLMPRGTSRILDRYMLALLVVSLILCIRLYQETIAPSLPALSLICIAAFAAFGISGTHDLFAMKRARLAAANRLLAAGVPATAFYGGFEYDGWTQIDQWGYVNANEINLPPGFQPRERNLLVKPCNYDPARLFIAIKPRYALSLSPDSCAGPSEFPSIPYHTWLPPFTGAIYTQRVAAATEKRP